MTKPTLLFVDDEERVVRSLSMTFRGEYRVLTTTNEHEALELLRQEQVEVIVSDQRMPNMLGSELLRQAREISPPTMRILLTGYSDLEAAIAAVNDGEIFRYIAKPWNAQALRDTVRQAADAAALHTQAQAAENSEGGKTETKPPLRVLVIDDDNTIAHEIRQVVAGACGRDCVIDYVDAVDKAMALLSEQEVNLVVTELRVNGEDIGATLKALKRHKPNVVTLVVTSHRDNLALIELINEGQIYRFLPKPVSKGLLGRSIQSAVRHYQLLHSAPALARRHVVEKSREERENRQGTRLSSFINRLRNRGGVSAQAAVGK